MKRIPCCLSWLVLPASLGLLVLAGCSDSGKDPTPPPPPADNPDVSRLVPARTVVGDTVIVQGARFGTQQGTGVVLFTAAAGGTVEAEVLPGSWTDASIRVLVPGQAAAGPVIVRQNGQSGAGVSFEVAPRIVSYVNDLMPLFQVKGCLSCHGGQNNLFVSPHASLMRGDSDHGPAVRARRSAESLLVQALGNSEPFGIPRMPPGSPALTGEQVLLISDWIDQGARNN